jgi:hypothetical protein
MNALSRFNRRCLLASSVLAAMAAMAALAVPAAYASEAAAARDAQYLIYLPSRSPGVDQAANIRAFEDNGMSVITFAYAGESDHEYARRIRDEVRSLIDNGTPPGAITVVGAGAASPVAALTSAMTGNRHVNYVLLGNCDPRLADDGRFHLSGRVLGVRDADDSASPSCRPLWRDAPKLGQRRDLVVRSGQGAAIFDAPRREWMQPVADWSRGGSVDVGEIRIGSRERNSSGRNVVGTAN